MGSEDLERDGANISACALYFVVIIVSISVMVQIFANRGLFPILCAKIHFKPKNKNSEIGNLITQMSKKRRQLSANKRDLGPGYCPNVVAK